jgi:hypothetical protein
MRRQQEDEEMDQEYLNQQDNAYEWTIMKEQAYNLGLLRPCLNIIPTVHFWY